MKYSRHAIAFFIALAFSWLFFERSAGINLIIFDILLLSAVYFLQREKLKSKLVQLFLFGVFSSSVFVVVHNSNWSIFIHHFSVFLLGGALASPQLKSVVSVMTAGVTNSVLSVKEFIVSRTPSVEPKRPAFRVLHALRLSIIPLIVLVVFGTLYANASPWFNTFWDKLGTFFTSIFGDLFNMISFTWFFTLVLGLLITVYLLFAKSMQSVDEMEKDQPDDLEKITPDASIAKEIKREYQVALLLFGSLNVMLFGQNILDLVHVWVGFEWQGAYLKQFVHEGTWLLIVSIFLSAILVLYYFRNQLNFIQNNKTLKVLTYIFIAQNAFLVASVAVRNIWYISYFNLAFKRIGVFFFLIAVLYGLYSVYIKINKQKTITYLVRKNSVVMYVLLLAIGFANWDTIIAKYNFSHADSAYVHLSFLSKLSNNALPYLQQPIEKLEAVKQDQDLNYGRDKYALSPVDYAQRIDERILEFKQEYERKDWLEWNYASWHAYSLLTK